MTIRSALLYPIIFIICASLVYLLLPPKLPLSPLGSPLKSKILNQESNQYLILGFAPYWNLKKLSSESLENITHFAYFALHLNEVGTIYTHVNKREQDPGYTNYLRLLSNSIDHGNKPVVLTFMPSDQDSLVSILSSPKSRSTTIKTILTSIQESHATGVNIDFEPLGDTPPSLRNNFTLFIKELRSELSTMSHKLLTISTYASAASRPRLWDLSALSPYTDYFVVMAYDYTMPGSTIAGPTSPLRGSGNLFEHDIIKNISEISRLVPPKKILLGIPFYGYQWDTVDSTKYSPVESRGSVASLERIQKMLDEKTLELIWDRNTLTPYGIATSSGRFVQIYFENEISIRLKLELVRSARLGGIAIWALGYEGNNTGFWPTINSLNH